MSDTTAQQAGGETAQEPQDSARTAILDTAQELFMERGYAATSMSRIAKQAGVAKSLIHHHFDSKRGLWGEVKDRMMQEYAEVQQRMLEEEEPDSSLLIRSIDVYFRFMQRRPDMARLLVYSCLEAGPNNTDDDSDASSEAGTQLIRLGIERIKEGQDLGLVRDDVEPIFVLRTFLGMVENWFLVRNWYCEAAGLSGEPNDEAYLDTIKKIFLEGILPPDDEE
jgi:TetR/AcrR family transcriptional regulator